MSFPVTWQDLQAVQERVDTLEKIVNNCTEIIGSQNKFIDLLRQRMDLIGERVDLFADHSKKNTEYIETLQETLLSLTQYLTAGGETKEPNAATALRAIRSEDDLPTNKTERQSDNLEDKKA